MTQIITSPSYFSNFYTDNRASIKARPTQRFSWMFEGCCVRCSKFNFVCLPRPKYVDDSSKTRAVEDIYFLICSFGDFLGFKAIQQN